MSVKCLNDVTNSTMYVYVLQASTTVAVLQAEAGKSESEQLLQQAQDDLKVLSFNFCRVMVSSLCSPTGS